MYKTSYPKSGDFLVDGKFTFEIGGKNKDKIQLSHVENAWIVKDEMEYPVGKSIPLWLFGFLY